MRYSLCASSPSLVAWAYYSGPEEIEKRARRGRGGCRISEKGICTITDDRYSAIAAGLPAIVARGPLAE